MPVNRIAHLLNNEPEDRGYDSKNPAGTAARDTPLATNAVPKERRLNRTREFFFVLPSMLIIAALTISYSLGVSHSLESKASQVPGLVKFYGILAVAGAALGAGGHYDPSDKNSLVRCWGAAIGIMVGTALPVGIYIWLFL